MTPRSTEVRDAEPALSERKPTAGRSRMDMRGPSVNAPPSMRSTPVADWVVLLPLVESER